VHLQALGRGRRRLLAPQLVDQALGRQSLVGMQEQQRQHSALLGAAEREHLSLVAGLQRAEDPEVHRAGPYNATKPDGSSVTGQRPGSYRLVGGLLPDGPIVASVFRKTVSTKAGRGGSQVAALTEARMPEAFSLSHAGRRRIALPPKSDPGSA
jgi:hypothetical protein